MTDKTVQTPVTGDPDAGYDARAIANFVLDHASNFGQQLTVMGILKLLYFAHGWHLAQTGRPLIRQRFEAWEFGPVVRVVYDCFKGIGRSPIRNRAWKQDPVTRAAEVVSYELSPETADFLRGISDSYAHLHAFKLSEMTHEPGSPWDRVWNDRSSIHLGMVIPNDAIRDYFISALNRQLRA